MVLGLRSSEREKEKEKERIRERTLRFTQDTEWDRRSTPDIRN
jgi:hypothetical protein